MQYIASCSFGKDSLAAIIVAEKNGIHIDEDVYCQIMFDQTTSAELPEHEEFIHTKAIPMLESRYGIKTTVVRDQKTYCDIFFECYKKGKNQGKIYGFPMILGAWCNSRLKMRPIKAFEKSRGEYVSVVGIAADEPKRSGRKTVMNKCMPLVDYGVTETEAFEVCKAEGLLSPAYNKGRKRLGCWFCHNQKLAELMRLRQEHPELWGKLLDLDAVSPITFKPTCTVRQLDERFADECSQLSIFDIIE